MGGGGAKWEKVVRSGVRRNDMQWNKMVRRNRMW